MGVNINLSQAIALGAKSTRKAKGKYINFRGREVRACVLGRAYIAGAAPSYPDITAQTLQQLFPILSEWREYPCTCFGTGTSSLMSILIHLNDQHTEKEWPVRDIIKYVEEIEGQLDRETVS